MAEPGERAKRKQIELECRKQLVVEGNDEERFFRAFLRHLSIRNVQVQSFQGLAHGSLERRLRLLQTPSGKGFSFHEVDALGIVRDAEKCAESAFASAKGACDAAELPSPESPGRPRGEGLKVGVWILPNNRDPGMLETLCLQSVEGSPLLECVAEFHECAQRASGDRIEVEPKAKLQAFVSMHKGVRLLGEAADKGVWDWGSDCFTGLSRFLLALFED